MGTVQSILLSFSIYDYWWNDKVNSRAHSMISISFHSGPAVSGRGLCDIDREGKYSYSLGFSTRHIIGPISPFQDFPFFDTRLSDSELYSIDITWSASAYCRAHTKYRNPGISPIHNLPINNFSKHGAQFLEENDIFSPEDDDDDDDDDD